jgi:hypothetical protein
MNNNTASFHASNVVTILDAFAADVVASFPHLVQIRYQTPIQPDHSDQIRYINE